MKTKGLFAPGYYPDFACIKGDCHHSCCIGWEIDVDDATLTKYASVQGEIGEDIRKSIDMDNVPHFRLVEERCPHLQKDGLCRILCELSSDYLSDICRLHPRFFGVSARGVEVGLGASCEEACRIILSSDDYDKLIMIGEEEAPDVPFDVTPMRDKVYSILKKKTPYKERLTEIADTFSADVRILSDEEWREILSSLEYLEDRHIDLFHSYSGAIDDGNADNLLERALAYFVYRHTMGAESAEEFRTGLIFALFCERLLASVIKDKRTSKFFDVRESLRIVSEEIEYSTENKDRIISEIEFALQ